MPRRPPKTEEEKRESRRKHAQARRARLKRHQDYVLKVERLAPEPGPLGGYAEDRLLAQKAYRAKKPAKQIRLTAIGLRDADYIMDQWEGFDGSYSKCVAAALRHLAWQTKQGLTKIEG